MPSEQQLEYEIALARNDLEQNLAELQLVVREKLDVRRRAREVYERARVTVQSFLARNVIAATVVASIGGYLIGRRRLRLPA